MAKSKKTGTAYQLKIVLAETRPPIWRRVQTQDCNLTKLHTIIQRAMGWYGGHLWAFDIDGEQYGENPWGDSDMDMLSSRSIKLSQLVDDGVKKFRYIYDFGDNWEHIVTVEKSLDADPTAKYPRCTAGKRACPPEDCGGPWSYDEFLVAISDPKHKEHKELLEWVGGEFDPEKFDLSKVNQQLAAIR
ncbi:MAG: plasmid pRiA4b ORF-3 family protein [Pirellulaceae bacterium]